jgi:hypothetical protein
MMIVGTQVRAKACPDLRPIAIPLIFFCFPTPLKLLVVLCTLASGFTTTSPYSKGL